MVKTECSVIRDLLPLYLEDMVKPETACFVKRHLEECPACQNEFESMRDVDGLAVIRDDVPVTQDDAIRPLKRIMKRLNRQTYMLSYTVIIIFILFGFSLTGGDNLMYNSLIMPVIGVFGYITFKWKAFLKMPPLLLAIDLAAYCFGLAEIDMMGVFIWTFIYSIFVLAGVAIAFLLHFAFRKEQL